MNAGLTGPAARILMWSCRVLLREGVTGGSVPASGYRLWSGVEVERGDRRCSAAVSRRRPGQPAPQLLASVSTGW